MRYTNTMLEDLVQDLYSKIRIADPNHSIDEIARRLRINLFYFRSPSFSTEKFISINPYLSPEKQKEVFAHELAHVLYHVGVQFNMPELFRLKQEFQAKNFSLHFCIPTFMLKKIEIPGDRNCAVLLLAETFGVTEKFASERLEKYERQSLGFSLQRKYTKEIVKMGENINGRRF